MGIAYFLPMKKPLKRDEAGSKGQQKGESSSDSKRENPDLQKLAKRIRTLRLEKGYTNADFFAYEHEFSRSQYNRYENGENIKFASLMKIIRAFGMTPKEFFSEGFE